MVCKYGPRFFKEVQAAELRGLANGGSAATQEDAALFADVGQMLHASQVAQVKRNADRRQDRASFSEKIRAAKLRAIANGGGAATQEDASLLADAAKNASRHRAVQAAYRARKSASAAVPNADQESRERACNRARQAAFRARKKAASSTASACASGSPPCEASRLPIRIPSAQKIRVPIRCSRPTRADSGCSSSATGTCNSASVHAARQVLLSNIGRYGADARAVSSPRVHCN